MREEYYTKPADDEPTKKAPPIGLRPRYIAVSDRMQEIVEAITRYVDAGKTPPGEWLHELGGLYFEHTKTMEN